MRRITTQFLFWFFLWAIPIGMLQAQVQLGSDVLGVNADDWAGYSTALSADGTRMIVGMPDYGTDRGRVRIYEYDGTNWVVMTDIDGVATRRRAGWSVTMSADGNRVAFGIPRPVIGGSNGSADGDVKIYDYNGTAWVEIQNLNGEADRDEFGTAVSLSDDGLTLAVGGIKNNGGGTNSGHVEVYRYNGAAWNQVGGDINGEAANDFFGRSVSLSADGNTLAVGAPLNNGGGTDAGHTRVFTYNGSAWVQKGVDLDGSSANDESGQSVALSDNGDRLIVGEPKAGTTDNGRVRIYDWDGSTWLQSATNSAISGSSSDQLGYAVAISGDGNLFIVGANKGAAYSYYSSTISAYETATGYAKTYGYNTAQNTWLEIGGNYMLSDTLGDELGFSVAIARDSAIVAAGAPYNHYNGDLSGMTRVYDLEDVFMRVYNGNGNFIQNINISPRKVGESTSFNFGGTAVAGGTISHTFTIESSGVLGDLMLTANPIVTISGTEFTVTTQPNAGPHTAFGNGTTTFTVEFDPAVEKYRSATVSINNNIPGSNNSPYQFTVRGFGIIPSTGVVFDGNNDYLEINSVADDMAGQNNFTMEAWVLPHGFSSFFNNYSGVIAAANPGTGAGDLAVLYVENDQIKFTSTTTGDLSFGFLNIPDTLRGGYEHFALSYDGAKLILYINGIYRGEHAIALPNFAATDRWSVGHKWNNSSSIDHLDADIDEVRIWRTARCAADLYNSRTCELLGTETDLVALYRFDEGLADWGNTITTVLDATAAGNNGVLNNLTMTDYNSSSNWTCGYMFTGGNCSPVAAPEMEVVGNGFVILDEDVTPDLADHTDFGQVSASAPLTRTFTINNTGTGVLNLFYGVQLSGTDIGDFSVVTNPSSSVAAGTGTTTFSILFTPTGLDLVSKTATVNIVGTDCNETLYSFEINGDVIGDPATGLSFDGTNDYVEINSVANDMAGKTAFSMEAWINTTNTSNNDAIVAANGPSGNSNLFILWLDNGVLGAVIGGSVHSFGVNLADGAWHHVAVTYDGTIATVYLEGIYLTEITVAVPAFTATDRWSIGQEWDSGTSDRFLGTMDEIRVWDRALCAAEIFNRRNCELAGTEANLMAYYKFNQGYIGMNNTEVIATDATTNVNNGNLLNFALTAAVSNWGVGNPVVSSTVCTYNNSLVPNIDITGLGTSIPNGTTATGVADDTHFGQSPIGTGVTHTFTINNNGTEILDILANITISGIDAVDFSVAIQPVATTIAAGGGTTTFAITFNPTGLDVSTRNAILTIRNTDCEDHEYTFNISGDAIGVPATGLAFDDNNDYIAINSVADDMAGKTEFTMEAWVNTTATGNHDAIIAANGPTGNVNRFVLYLRNGALSTLIDATTHNFGISIANTGWRHVAATYDGSIVKVYVDGVYQAQRTVVVPAFTATDRWSIGQEWDSGASDRFSGRMDEARIWDRALCAAEIFAQMNCELAGTEANLMAYYKFNQGYLGLNNVDAIAIDATANANNGVLTNFALTGSTQSNWVTGNTAVSTTTCIYAGDPEVDVTGNGVSITNGDASPDVADDTYFGQVINGAPATHVFTINNTAGVGPLNLFGNITISGVDAADFTITTQPATTTLAAGTGSTTFSIAFNPLGTAVTTRTALITIINTDCDEQPYTFTISGDAVGPPATAFNFNTSNNFIEINSVADDMAGKTNFSTEAWFEASASSANRDVILAINGGASGDNNTYWLLIENGLLKAYDGSVLHTFGTTDLRNTGWHHAAITYNGSILKVYLDGIYIGEVTTTIAAFTAIDRWSIGQEFDGTTTPTDEFFGSIDEVRIWDKELCAAEIYNSMNCELAGTEANLIAYYKLNQGYVGMDNITETTAIDATANGNTGNLVNMDLIGAVENWNVGNTSISTTTCIYAGDPEMDVRGNSVSITNGDASPYVADDTDFGQAINGAPVAHVFTINNTAGVGPLNLFGNITISGVDAADFTVTAQPSTTTLAAGTGSTTFTIAFNPLGTAVTTRTALVTIINTDCDEQPYTFTISGDAVGPPATGLNFDGSNDYVAINSVADDMVGKTEFSVEAWINSIATSSNDVVVAANGSTGNANIFALHLQNGVLSFLAGVNRYSFTTNLSNAGWHHVAATYDGTVVKMYLDGVYQGEVTTTIPAFAVNDRWSIGQEFDAVGASERFNGTLDEVRIWDKTLCAAEIFGRMSCELAGTESNLMAYYPLNQAYVGMNNVTETVTIDATANMNNGTLTNFSLAGNTSNWAVGNPVVSTTTCFYAGDPEINVTGNSVTIVDGSTIPNTLDHTQFGAVSLALGGTPTTRTFTVENTSINPMYVDAITITGVDAADFSVTTTPFSATIGGNNSLSFTVTFNPSTAGLKNATIEISSVDCDETIYDFAIQGLALEVISDVRGSMLTLDGVNDYVNINDVATTMSGAGSFTFEIWIKPDAAQTGPNRIVSVNTAGGNNVALFYLEDGLLKFYDGSNTRVFGATDLRGTGWHHVTLVHQDNPSGSDFTHAYIDGVLIGTFTGSVTNFTNSNLWSIGQDYDSGPVLSDFFQGDLDEVRIWNGTRTQQAIRESMHISLTGYETNLVAYYQFDNDDAAGTANGAKDVFGSNGQTFGGLSYTASEVAVGGGTSFTHNVTATGNYDFTGTDLEINFVGSHPNDEVVVSQIVTQNPYNESAGILVNNTNTYWVVNNFGTNTSLDATLKFKFVDGTITNPIPTNSSIHKRGSRGWQVANWTDNVATAVGTNSGDNHVTISNITSFSQFDVTSSNASLPIELLSFTAKRENIQEVYLDWSTSTETNNKGFEVQRMLEGATTFETIAWVDGHGTTTVTQYYQLIDKNSFTDVSYYRLKQIDFDGTVSYSDIRAVEGTEAITLNVAIYPNPVEYDLNIRFNELTQEDNEVNIKVMTLHGQLVHQMMYNVQAHEIIQINTKDLVPAMYVLSIEINGEVFVQKFVKERS